MKKVTLLKNNVIQGVSKIWCHCGINIEYSKFSANRFSYVYESKHAK